MIPTIALMIAVYGTARLLNEGLSRHSGSIVKILTWTLGIMAIVILWFLAFMVNQAGL